MPRYFLEVAYNGKNYSGFQRQQNANSIQAEIEKAIFVLAGAEILLTGSSRTDAGVHALQNYFHFDSHNKIEEWRDIADGKSLIYKLNSILPWDISVKKINGVHETAHCRFDAVSREYNYYVYQTKDPFLADRAYYYPYRLDFEKLQAAADLIKEYNDFSSFCKRNTQVKSYKCNVYTSRWVYEKGQLVYNVRANRFLRGMVKGLVATQLKVGRGKITMDGFRQIIENGNSSATFFSAPAKGLFLKTVSFPNGYLLIEEQF